MTNVIICCVIHIHYTHPISSTSKLIKTTSIPFFFLSKSCVIQFQPPKPSSFHKFSWENCNLVNYTFLFSIDEDSQIWFSCNLYFGLSQKKELIGLQMHARDQKLKFRMSHFPAHFHCLMHLIKNREIARITCYS